MLWSKGSTVSFPDYWMEKLPEKLKNETVSHATLAKLSEALGKDWQLFALAELGVAVFISFLHFQIKKGLLDTLLYISFFNHISFRTNL